MEVSSSSINSGSPPTQIHTQNPTNSQQGASSLTATLNSTSVLSQYNSNSASTIVSPLVKTLEYIGVKSPDTPCASSVGYKLRKLITAEKKALKRKHEFMNSISNWVQGLENEANKQTMVEFNRILDLHSRLEEENIRKLESINLQLNHVSQREVKSEELKLKRVKTFKHLRDQERKTGDNQAIRLGRETLEELNVSIDVVNEQLVRSIDTSLKGALTDYILDVQNVSAIMHGSCNDFFTFLNTGRIFARPAYLLETNNININTNGITQQTVTNQGPINVIAENKIQTLDSRIEAGPNNKENQIVENKRQEQIEPLNLPEKKKYMEIDVNDRFCYTNREETRHDSIQEHSRSHSHSRTHSHSPFAPPETEKLQFFESTNNVRCLECHMFETKDGPSHLQACSHFKKLDYQRPESHQSQETQQSHQSKQSQQTQDSQVKSQTYQQTPDSQSKSQIYQQNHDSDSKSQMYQQTEQTKDTQEKQQIAPPIKHYNIRVPSLIRNRFDNNVWQQ
ncbi:unnamed protein product [Ambrosiozyma monospora]|uniref:Unnamed protein product n=1 Tax=Ambrosiozyma monospora TaxID=43982 RepID=A0ACB5SWK0_AMBMO|nr:unnamed protein product [Ambrosiozyma monospora]